MALDCTVSDLNHGRAKYSRAVLENGHVLIQVVSLKRLPKPLIQVSRHVEIDHAASIPCSTRRCIFAARRADTNGSAWLDLLAQDIEIGLFQRWVALDQRLDVLQASH